jgi:hypothetical protein
LTNALKYAAVRVRYGIDSLESALVGMRERMALCDGTLDAGRRPARGFAVRILLPFVHSLRR